VYRGEGYKREYILTNYKIFWNRYIKRILGRRALDIIIKPELNKCLCRYIINGEVKVYHYKMGSIKLFTSYPIEDIYEKCRTDIYFEDFLIKFKMEKIVELQKNKVCFYINFIVNLNKFIIKNEQTEIDKELQLFFINKLKESFSDNNKIKIEYKNNEFYKNKKRLMVELNFQELSMEDCVKYNSLFIKQDEKEDEKEEDINIKELCKEFIKEKINDNLLL
jgi:hypothetical protein